MDTLLGRIEGIRANRTLSDADSEVLEEIAELLASGEVQESPEIEARSRRKMMQVSTVPKELQLQLFNS